MRSYADTHCDTVVKLYCDGQRLRKNAKQIDLERLSVYGTGIQVFALWLQPWYYEKAFVRTMQYLRFYQAELAANQDKICPAFTYADIEKNKQNNKISAILSLEGGEAIESDLERISFFYEQGVRMLSLTWNHGNALADGVLAPQKGGLTSLGKRAVQNMEKMGMILDVSHLSDAGFYEVAHLMQKPFIASHSNARAICDHPRNLTDAQLQIMREIGGYVGLNFYPPFVAQKESVGTEDLLRQLLYLLDKAGEDAVGFGTDFDGIDKMPYDMRGVEDMTIFLERLEKELGPTLLQKVCEENFLRVTKKIWKDT